MSNGAVNVSVPISTQDRAQAGSGDSASTFGGFGGPWTVNQKGAGITGWHMAAGLAVAGLAWYMLKRKKG